MEHWEQANPRSCTAVPNLPSHQINGAALGELLFSDSCSDVQGVLLKVRKKIMSLENEILTSLVVLSHVIDLAIVVNHVMPSRVYISSKLQTGLLQAPHLLQAGINLPIDHAGNPIPKIPHCRYRQEEPLQKSHQDDRL
jgi:hypothetical protein